MAPESKSEMTKWMKIGAAIIGAFTVIFGAISSDLHISPSEPIPKCTPDLTSQTVMENRLRALEIISAGDHEAIRHIEENTNHMRDQMDRFIESQAKRR